MSFLHLSLLLIHFFLTLSILPSCLTLRRSATQPSIQASKLIIKRYATVNHNTIPRNLNFPSGGEGSNQWGVAAWPIDHLLFVKVIIWIEFSIAKFCFTVELRFFLDRIQSRREAKKLWMERENARAHNFLHDAWAQSYYPRWWQYGPNLWCNLVQRRSHRPHFFGIDRLPQRLHQAAPMVVVDVIPYPHTELIWVVQTWSFLFPGKIFRSKEQY
jgi:hypothetical protein